MTALLVVSPGLLTTVQDLGRTGLAHLGVPGSGAADQGSLRLANRLVGNPEGAAGLEVLGGIAEFRTTRAMVVAVTGGRCVLARNGRPEGRHVALALAAGETLSLGPVDLGLRVYLAVRGGLDVPAVLGSRSHDQLSGLGPPPLRAGQVLGIGTEPLAPPLWEQLPVAEPAPEPVLRVLPGPRVQWLTHGLASLTGAAWTVSNHSNRSGSRLVGPALARRPGELASEGVLPGAIQLPADGQPILLGPDAGVTGGYPVVAVVVAADLDAAGQLSPGTKVRFITRS